MLSDETSSGVTPHWPHRSESEPLFQHAYKRIFWLALFLLLLYFLGSFSFFTMDFSCCPPKVKLPCFGMRYTHSLWMQPVNACGPINVLWKGKEKVKLSYWIDWTFMKLKRALPPTPSHVEMTSRHFQSPVRSTAVRIPTLQSGAELLPCRHNSIVKSLMNRSARAHFTTQHLYTSKYSGLGLYWNNCTIILTLHHIL